MEDNIDICEILKQLRARLEIDEYALERECRDHSALYAEIGDLQVEAKSVAANTKKDLEFLCDDLDEKIRLDPEKNGLTGKVTEGAVSSAIRRVKDYRELQEKYLGEQKIANHFQILLSAAEQRKSMLRDCKDLFIHNYYSTIGLGREAKELSKFDEEAYMKYKKGKHEREREDSKRDKESS